MLWLMSRAVQGIYQEILGSPQAREPIKALTGLLKVIEIQKEKLKAEVLLRNLVVELKVDGIKYEEENNNHTNKEEGITLLFNI